MFFFFFQAEDGIRDLVRSRGLGDVYKRQILLTGKPYSSFKLNNQHELPFQVSELTLMPARNTLYAAIDKRVDFMIKSGLVDETKSLLQFRNCQALDTVGYKEIISYLDGNITLEAVSYTHLRAHETVLDLVCRLLLEKKKQTKKKKKKNK